MSQQLSQQEIDDFFQSAAREEAGGEAGTAPFDFRRSDRIPKSQLSIVHFLHEAFVQTLTSSLSVYLRSYVSGNVISVEQLPYGEFTDALASPTCLVYLSMQPYEESALVEVSQSLISPVLDFALGGNGKINTELGREISDIEETMLAGFFRIIAHDLMEAWKPIAAIQFAVDCIETKPQFSKRIPRNEALVTVAMELRVGEHVGMLNLAVPSITLKMLRHKFDQQSAIRKPGSGEVESAIKQHLSNGLKLDVECALTGAKIRLQDLVHLKPGDVIDCGIAANGAAAILVNGIQKFQSELVAHGGRQAAIVRTSY